MRGFIRFILYSFLLWIFFAYVGPYMVSLSENWQHYNAVQEENNLHSGALYYTDVPVSLESENANREAVKRAYEKN